MNSATCQAWPPSVHSAIKGVTALLACRVVPIAGAPTCESSLRVLTIVMHASQVGTHSGGLHSLRAGPAAVRHSHIMPKQEEARHSQRPCNLLRHRRLQVPIQVALLGVVVSTDISQPFIESAFLC